MSHGITATDHAFYGNRTPAWHRLGTVIDEPVVTSAEALSLARLDWAVEQHPLYAHLEVDGMDEPAMIEVPDKVANVRMDTGTIVGVVGDRYSVLQNTDAFGFFDEILGRGDAHYETAGSLYGGKKIWALARLNRDILIGGDPDEKIDPYVCLVNGHDGNTAVSVYTTPIRVVCQNTLQWSIKDASNTWKARHTSSVTDRARDARDMLGFSNAYFDALQTIGDRLINTSMNTASFNQMLDMLVPIPDVADGDNTRGRTIAENTQAAIADAWYVDNIANVKDTRWGFVQAVAEYVDWSKNHRSDERFLDQNLLNAGVGRSLKDRSLDIALHA